MFYFCGTQKKTERYTHNWNFSTQKQPLLFIRSLRKRRQSNFTASTGWINHWKNVIK
jgi:hypothetical protein